MSRRVVLAGGGGLIGSFLREKIARDYDIVVLTRSPRENDGDTPQVRWDGRTLGEWTRELDGARALINLSGRSVNCRYNARNRHDILESRVETTRILGEAIARSREPPPVWLNASTATIYKHTFDRLMDEATGEIGATPEAKDGFSIEVACAWEQTLNEARTPATRKVALRTAMVFAASEGGGIPNSPKPHAMGAGRLYCRWAPIHFLDSRRRFLPRRRMVDRARRFHRAGQRGLAEPDSATRDDENHPSRVRNALWIARDAPDA